MLSLVEEVAFSHIDARTAGYLLKFAEGKDNAVNATHREIADELGTSREVITRILKDFESRGLIETQRGRILVLRPAELEKWLAPQV